MSTTVNCFLYFWFTNILFMRAWMQFKFKAFIRWNYAISNAFLMRFPQSNGSFAIYGSTSFCLFHCRLLMLICHLAKWKTGFLDHGKTDDDEIWKMHLKLQRLSSNVITTICLIVQHIILNGTVCLSIIIIIIIDVVYSSCHCIVFLALDLQLLNQIAVWTITSGAAWQAKSKALDQ